MGLDLFSAKKPALIGVEVGASAVKMVELSMTPKGMKLERYAIEQVPAGVVSDGHIDKVDEMAEVLLKCHKKLDSRIRAVAASMPQSMVISKKIRMTGGLKHEEIEAQILSDASGDLPFPIEEADFDFKVISRGEGEGQDDEIFLAACQKDNVLNRVSALEAASLKPVIVDADLLATIDVVEHFLDVVAGGHQGKNILVLEMGTSSTTYTFIRDGDQKYSREHQFGGGQLTDAIAEHFKVDAAKARQWKYGSSEVPNKDEYDVLVASFLQSAALEAQRAVQLFMAHGDDAQVDHVVICGSGGNAIDGFDEALHKEVGAPAYMLDPFAGMQLNSKIDARRLRREAPSLAIACGLAMRRFDK